MAVPVVNFAEAGFNRFEVPVVARLHRYLTNDANGPLLTNNEEDLVILDDPTFFDHVSQGSVPRNAVEELRSGGLTRTELVRKMQIGRNITRLEKSEMYVERIITATVATDTCRSLFSVATGNEFVPVLADDTVETVTHRVGDYVTDLLVAGRERRVLRNAAMHRLTDTIRAKFDTNPNAGRVLTAQAGMNSRKKVSHYIKSLAEVSRGYERMTKDSKTKLNDYMASRPDEYQDKLDLYILIAQKAS